LRGIEQRMGWHVEREKERGTELVRGGKKTERG